MWVCRVVCQWCPGQWGQGSWPEWPPSGQGQPAGQEASYWPPQGAPPSLGWFDVPQASGCWGPVGELGMRIGKQETVSTGCNAVTLWCHNTLSDFLKKWKPFSKQPRGFLCCSTHNGENQAWHIVLCATPSTISSESSRKNSLSGGLLGRLSVFNSCWILVDTLLLTGTPGQTPRAAAVTNICKQTMTRRHPHMQVYSNMNLYFNTRSLAHTGSNLRTSSQEQNQQQEKFEREICTQGDTEWTILSGKYYKGRFLLLHLQHETNVKRGRYQDGKQATWGLFGIPPLPQVRCILPFLFPFLNQSQDRDRINGPKRKNTKYRSLAAFTTQWHEDDVEGDRGWTWVDCMLIGTHSITFLTAMLWTTQSMQNSKTSSDVMIRIPKWLNCLKWGKNQKTVTQIPNISENEEYFRGFSPHIKLYTYLYHSQTLTDILA